MADLSANVKVSLGRAVLMAPSPTLSVFAGPENWRLVELLQRSITLLGLPAAEALSLYANTVTAIRGNTGQVAFNASPDHVDVTSYTARVRVSGSVTITATQALGKPTPDGNNVIVVDLSATFTGLAAGNYTVSILATSDGGSADSTESPAFALPSS